MTRGINNCRCYEALRALTFGLEAPTVVHQRRILHCPCECTSPPRAREERISSEPRVDECVRAQRACSCFQISDGHSCTNADNAHVRRKVRGKRTKSHSDNAHCTNSGHDQCGKHDGAKRRLAGTHEGSMDRVSRGWRGRREYRAFAETIVRYLTLTKAEEGTYSAKYHAPITPAQVTRSSPRATPHVHNQTPMVPAIAQCAHSATGHAARGFSVVNPTRSRRKARVMNGMESRNIASNTAGDSARRNGFSISRRVVRVRRDEAV